MTHHSKLVQRISIVTASILSLGVVVPSTAMAAVTSPSQTTSAKESNFCSNFSSISGKTSGNINNLVDKSTAARSKQDKAITGNRSKESSKIQANRDKWDKQRVDGFSKLETRAKTDAEKSAVKAYESSVLQAIATRRAANDAARISFVSGVDAVIASHRTEVDNQISTFKAAVASAVSVAQSSCTATPTNGPAIRAKFVADTKAARESYKSARSSDAKVGDQVKQLAQTRNASFKTNDSTFDATTKSALDALKTAFHNKSI